MGRILSILVALITMGTAANATTLATAGIYGGPVQNLAICHLFNAGDSAVSVQVAKIIREAVGSLVLTGNNCTPTLAAGGICRFFAPTAPGLAHACKVVIEPSGAHVRGELQIRDVVGYPLQNEQLR